jgi:hypothetical protein
MKPQSVHNVVFKEGNRCIYFRREREREKRSGFSSVFLLHQKFDKLSQNFNKYELIDFRWEKIQNFPNFFSEKLQNVLGEKKTLEEMDHGMPSADITLILISWLLFWELVVCSHVESCGQPLLVLILSD